MLLTYILELSEGFCFATFQIIIYHENFKKYYCKVIDLKLTGKNMSKR